MSFQSPSSTPMRPEIGGMAQKYPRNMQTMQVRAKSSVDSLLLLTSQRNCLNVLFLYPHSSYKTSIEPKVSTSLISFYDTTLYLNNPESKYSRTWRIPGTMVDCKSVHPDEFFFQSLCFHHNGYIDSWATKTRLQDLISSDSDNFFRFGIYECRIMHVFGRGRRLCLVKWGTKMVGAMASWVHHVSDGEVLYLHNSRDLCITDPWHPSYSSSSMLRSTSSNMLPGVSSAF